VSIALVSKRNRLTGFCAGFVFTGIVFEGLPRVDGHFGWDGAYGTHFWDPKEKIVGIMMVQTDWSRQSFR
jgi:hypothetical protein